MPVSKQQKERDKAIRHLFDYIDRSEKWLPRIEEMTDHFMGLVIDNLGEDEASVRLRLERGDHGAMIYGFLMELMAVTSWDAERVTPIDEYLKQRGWREGTHGRRYLSALNESELHFLEVTAVEPGEWVEVRLFGTNAEAERIIERGGSQGLHAYDAIVARLVKLGKSHRFGSILPLSHFGAKRLKMNLDNIESDLKALYEEAVAEDGPDGLVKNFVDSIDYERRIRIEETGFVCFASDVLGGPSMAIPQLFNTDNEHIVITKTRFPIIGDNKAISQILNNQDDLIDDSETHWSWLNSGGANTRLGTFELSVDTLVFETNSVERSKKGIAFLQSCLGSSLIGEPMSVHENIEDTMASVPAIQPEDSIDVSQHPELQGIMQEMMKGHYLKTLDEAIPMLDNESPRACAADPDKHHKVIDWLKYMENMESKSPNSAQDFSWMWEELGLADYR